MYVFKLLTKCSEYSMTGSYLLQQQQQHPQMRPNKITEKIIKKIRSGMKSGLHWTKKWIY